MFFVRSYFSMSMLLLVAIYMITCTDTFCKDMLRNNGEYEQRRCIFPLYWWIFIHELGVKCMHFMSSRMCYSLHSTRIVKECLSIKLLIFLLTFRGMVLTRGLFNERCLFLYILWSECPFKRGVHAMLLHSPCQIALLDVTIQQSKSSVSVVRYGGNL